MSRIAATFDKLRAARRAALVPFVTAGDPSPAHTVAVLRALVKAGADEPQHSEPQFQPMRRYPGMSEPPRELVALGAVAVLAKKPR